MNQKKSDQVVIRSAYSKKERLPAAAGGETLTQQQFVESSNINNIMARYQKTGMIDHVAKYEGSYGDATGRDFKSAMDTITNAQSMFDELPSKARSAFDNDPAKFLDFVNDPETSHQDLYDLGLTDVKPPAEEPKTPAEKPEKSPERAEAATSSKGAPIDPT